MFRRSIVTPLLAAFCFLLIVTGLYLGREHLTWPSNSYIPAEPDKVQQSNAIPTSTKTGTSTEVPTRTSSQPSPTATALSPPTISNGTVLSAERISPYISAILDSKSTVLPRLKCPALNVDRYSILKSQRFSRDEDNQDHKIDYFFALNLRNCKDILPRLLGSIVEAARFLGIDRCALSIVEGNSPDGTSDILSALGPFLKDFGLVYFYSNSKINPAKGARIRKLAQLRNLALEPLLKKKVLVSDDTTVLFLNDVAACSEDILELVLQKRSLNADMTCGMDWTYVGEHPTFYDVWIGRTISGDSYFEIGLDGNWNSAWNLFPNDFETRSRYDAKKPFQVFACWNGAITITAAPLLHGLKFRDVHEKECVQGEPTLLCKDLWHRGYKKIAVVPSVNLEYSDKRAADIKQLKGYVSDIVEDQEDDGVIQWISEPPDKIKCMPTWEHQFWRPWNETL
uniref:WGS project CBMI000000000 data, contig CS3069_c001264 n=1 Tax=Fusarium clavum TaxID=2594811 RepID=A0A090MBH0_9HYPO|nr:unnamed protein product [Fusarium clavum]